MVVRGAPNAATAQAQAKLRGPSIGHILSDRVSDLRAAIADIAAHAKKGLPLASTGPHARELLANWAVT